MLIKSSSLEKEHYSIDKLIENSKEYVKYLGEDSVGYQYMQMLTFLMILNNTYDIKLKAKPQTKEATDE